jgi:hypothetical protein
MVTELHRIESIMRNMVAGKSNPYDEGREIWTSSMRSIEQEPDVMHPFWLIWGALTDWVELRPSETDIAEEKMLRAAREWLALSPTDGTSRLAYFDRWIYEELGYERKKS